MDCLDLSAVFAAVIFREFHMYSTLMTGQLSLQCPAEGKLLSDVEDMPLKFCQLLIKHIIEGFHGALNLCLDRHFKVTVLCHPLSSASPLLPTVCKRQWMWGCTAL